MSDITIGELGRRIEAMQTEMRQGFGHVGQRIDELAEQVGITNGQVSRLKEDSREEKQKVVNLEREVFTHGRPRASLVTTTPLDGGGGSTRQVVTTQPAGAEPITRRDLTIAIATAAAIFALIEWLPALVQAGKAATP